MPQASFHTDDGIGQNSRYMAQMRFTDVTMRRMQVINALEGRAASRRVAFMERETNKKFDRFNRMKVRLTDNLTKRMAYKLVLKTQTFSAIKDKKMALDKRYTKEAFHNDIKLMMKKMKPEVLRERKAKLLVDESRLKFENIMLQNRQKFNRLYPEKITWYPRYTNIEVENKTPDEPEVSSATRRQNEVDVKRKQSLATLRRRVISIDSAPASPTKLPPIPATRESVVPSAPTPRSPVKTPAIANPADKGRVVTNKRQGITMSMMKRQQSFLENKERTCSPTDLTSYATQGDVSTNNGTLRKDKPEEVLDNGSKSNKELHPDTVIPETAREHLSSARTSPKTGRKTSDGDVKLPSIAAGKSQQTPRLAMRSGDPVKLPPIK